MNEFTLAVHKRMTMMEFPAVGSDHRDRAYHAFYEPCGSPNNVHPVYEANGHYKGQVNFTMDGWWQVHVMVKRGDTLIGEMDFNLTFAARWAIMYRQILFALFGRNYISAGRPKSQQIVKLIAARVAIS